MANRSRNQQDSGIITKSALFAAIMALVYWGFKQFGGSSSGTSQPQTEQTDPASDVASNTDNTSEVADLNYLPTGGTGEIVRHKYLTLSYSEPHEQAEWVAYELTSKQLSSWVERQDDFRPDPNVSTGSATPNDYRGSGYDRGHLCASADRSFSREAQTETFFMSNMSPQVGPFNKGIWRELEENVRDWAKRFKHLYVVTGPVLAKRPEGHIGKQNQVSVPVSYYKVLLDVKGGKAIAFVIPNDVSDVPINDFAMSVDECERITKLNFFPKVTDARTEASLEGNFDLTLWPFDKLKFKQRVEKWNKQ